MKSKEIPITEYSIFNAPYINSAGSMDIIEGLEKGLEEIISLMESLSVDKLEYRYSEGKWTIKDILLHIIDAERIFGYRALRIGRGDRTPLHGFDENDYAPHAMANNRSLKNLLNEFKSVRNSTLYLFSNFSNEQLLYMGNVSGHDISVRAIGFIINGHQNHHLKIIKERYL